MTTIYLIRHAQAEGNLYRRCHSWHNGLLTHTGREQVKALEKRFEGVHFDAAYSSDLYRTMSTAGAVCRTRGLTLRVDPQLREIGAGVWEDVPWGQLLHDHRDSLAAFLRCDPAWQVEGSETHTQVRRRVRAAVEARQISMYLIRVMTNLSQDNIGQLFDNRDHSTVIHSIRQVEQKMKKDPAFAEMVKELKSNITSRH